MSSAAAVDRVRKQLGAARAGHGGTLDPLATGVLPIAVGAATKLASFLLAEDKAYEAHALLGAATSTLDRSGMITEEKPWAHVTRDAVLAALAARVGEQDQIPPMHSAIKVDGVRLYRRAHAGEAIDRAPRRVRVDRLELLAFEPPRLVLAIACGKGMYVRSLIADVAADLGTVGHMTELRRTRAGAFAIADAIALADVTPATRLVPLEDLCQLPRVAVTDAELLRLVLHAVQIDPARLGAAAERFQLVDGSGKLLAIAHADAGKVIYDRVFPELHRDGTPRAP
jgi:tRNA pseudouridine55 synthase